MNISIKKQYVRQPRVQKFCDPKTGRTHQSFKDECDINYLVQTWLKTGVMPVFNSRTPFYGDVSSLPSYQEAQNLVVAAEQAFAQLTPEQQAEFDGPLDYLEAVYAAQDSASEEVGTLDLLDVNVPTDTKPAKKGDEDGTSSVSDASEKKSSRVQKNGDPSQA